MWDVKATRLVEMTKIKPFIIRVIMSLIIMRGKNRNTELWSGKHNNLKNMVWEKSRGEAFFVKEDWDVVVSVDFSKVHDGKQEY